MRAIILAFAITLITCGCGASAREKTIHATFISVTAARDGFVAWDAQHQLDVVKASSSAVMGEVALSDYHAHRVKVTVALEAAYRALAAAAIIESDPTLTGIVHAAQEVYQAISTLQQISVDGGGPLPGRVRTAVPKDPPTLEGGTL